MTAAADILAELELLDCEGAALMAQLRAMVGKESTATCHTRPALQRVLRDCGSHRQRV